MNVLTMKFTVAIVDGQKVLQFDHMTNEVGRVIAPLPNAREGDTFSIDREFSSKEMALFSLASDESGMPILA